MKVILMEELPGRGGEGDVIEVARGYANYLMIEGIAIEATKGNLKQLELRRKNIAKREEVRINGAETRKGQLEALTLVIPTKVGEEGQLFGSVTAQMIADAIAEQNEAGIEVDRRRIELREPIKTVGEHEAIVSLYRDIKATVKVNVVDQDAPEEAPAEAAEDVAEEAAEVVEEAAEAAEEVAEAAEAEAEAEAEEAAE